MYWAPEQLGNIVGRESDYWALGVIALEIVQKKHPFEGLNHNLIMSTLASRGIIIPQHINPEILILDDSTSALDFATDAAVRSEIRKNYQNTTVFIVSQRASSIKYADKILVFDDGVLSGCGTHAELMKTCAVYREICLSQLSSEEVYA